MAADPPLASNRTRNKQASGNRGRLEHGKWYSATIRKTNATTQEFTVVVTGTGEEIGGCVYATPMFASLFGMKMSWRPGPGTQVILLYGNPSYIVANVPADLQDPLSFKTRTMTDAGDTEAKFATDENDKKMVPHHTEPNDLFEGEFEIGNLLGPFIRMLTFMSSVGAGDRAKIEFHLLRDLVRVVSKNFEHFSAFGDMKIYNDGRLNVEWNGTLYDHERWGKMSPNDEKTVEDKLLETGRWRTTMLLGFLGDTLNQWFTDPAGTVGKMAEEAVRSGRARFHVGSDGGILVQSVSDIALERVCRIPVPIRLKHQEDPRGVLAKEMDNLERQFLKDWDDGGGKTAHHTMYQIRDYARWLGQYHSLARILQLESARDEWKIPSESDTPEPDPFCAERDRKTANASKVVYKDVYATIRIFRDGSILNNDAYGNAMASGMSGIVLSSATHFRSYAAGDISMTAGGSMYFGARRNMEFAASRGGIRMKARTLFHALCELGTLWLKSDADPDDEPDVDEGDPEPEMIDKQGIRIESILGETKILSDKKMHIGTTGDDDGDEGEDKAALILTSNAGAVKIVSTAKDVLLKTAKKLFLSVAEEVMASCSKWIGSGKYWSFGNAVKITGTTVNAQEVNSYFLRAKSLIAGPKSYAQTLPNDTGMPPLKQHLNHVAEVDEDLEVDLDVDLIDPAPSNRYEPWKGLVEFLAKGGIRVLGPGRRQAVRAPREPERPPGGGASSGRRVRRLGRRGGQSPGGIRQHGRFHGNQKAVAGRQRQLDVGGSGGRRAWKTHRKGPFRNGAESRKTLGETGPVQVPEARILLTAGLPAAWLPAWQTTKNPNRRKTAFLRIA